MHSASVFAYKTATCGYTVWHGIHYKERKSEINKVKCVEWRSASYANFFKRGFFFLTNIIGRAGGNSNNIRFFRCNFLLNCFFFFIGPRYQIGLGHSIKISDMHRNCYKSEVEHSDSWFVLV